MIARSLETTGDYRRIQDITGDYQGLLEITRDYWRLREITEDHHGSDGAVREEASPYLHPVSCCYRRVSAACSTIPTGPHETPEERMS